MSRTHSIYRGLWIFLLFLTSHVNALAYVTERVVVVIIDGLRYSEGLGDPENSYTPHMRTLADQGALVANFQNDGLTYTSRAVPAIWCGGWTEVQAFTDTSCNNETNNYTELPSLFEYYRKDLLRPAEDCVYVLKDLCSWKGSFHNDYGPAYWPLYHTVGQSDTDVYQETVSLLSTLAPHFLLMYLADVDHEGHSGSWENYTNAIQIADSLVGELWTWLQNDPTYAGITTLLITNDHGRHSYNFAGHGDDCQGCRHIQLLAVGPDTPPSLLSNTDRRIPDIAPSVAALLDFSTPYATGTPMVELFDHQSAVNVSPSVPDLFLKVFPNPSNNAATIQFNLEQAASVSVTVLDVSGGVHSQFRAGWFEPGRHQLRWQPMPDQASGIYIVQVQTRLGRYTQKFSLIK